MAALWYLLAIAGLIFVALGMLPGLQNRISRTAIRGLCIAAVLLVASPMIEISRNQEKGISLDPSDAAVLTALFVSMLLGMAASTLKQRIDTPRRHRKKGTWEEFIYPVLVSPMIFVPLLALFDQTPGLQVAKLSAPRLMLFFIAFENGFLWKQYYASRVAKVETSDVSTRG